MNLNEYNIYFLKKNKYNESDFKSLDDYNYFNKIISKNNIFDFHNIKFILKRFKFNYILYIGCLISFIYYILFLISFFKNLFIFAKNLIEIKSFYHIVLFCYFVYFIYYIQFLIPILMAFLICKIGQDPLLIFSNKESIKLTLGGKDYRDLNKICEKVTILKEDDFGKFKKQLILFREKNNNIKYTTFSINGLFNTTSIFFTIFYAGIIHYSILEILNSGSIKISIFFLYNILCFGFIIYFQILRTNKKAILLKNVEIAFGLY